MLNLDDRTAFPEKDANATGANAGAGQQQLTDRRRHSQTLLEQWVAQTLEMPQVRVQVRFRGNNLHILCEATRCPEALTVVSRLLPGLLKTDVNTLIPVYQPPVYQVFLYGRAFKAKRPEWTEPLYLNQLERHQEQLERILAAPTESDPKQDTPAPKSATPDTPSPSQSPTPNLQPPTLTGSALILSNRSLARQGYPDAIARYLSETLSLLGVGVQVKAEVRRQEVKSSTQVETPTSNLAGNRRLWIVCESTYSPDPSLLAEPIAQQLRELALEGIKDAVIFSQVRGETRPDWKLRVDLTPPEEMLRDWARWGDVQAIARLLQQSLAERNLEVSVTLKESTLHLFCSIKRTANSANFDNTAPEKEQVLGAIAPLLETLAPQGIHAATVYGQVTGQETPLWIDWLNLPAGIHPALAELPLALAQQGDQPALIFLLSRLLNPDLDWRLATGGIRIQLLQKDDLLHIMTDAPVCPQQSQVEPPIDKFLRQLRLPKINGARLYGRRAGEKAPIWCAEIDFVPRQRFVPEAAPEFAASDVYVGDLITQSPELILHPDWAATEVQATLSRATAGMIQSVQTFLIRSQLFLPSDQVPGQAGYTGLKTALVWGALGLLLTLQMDWVMGHLFQTSASQATLDVITVPGLAQASAPAPDAPPPSTPIPLPSLSLQKSQADTSQAVFNASGFTQPGAKDVVLDNGSPTNAGAAETPPIPTPNQPKRLIAEPIRTSPTMSAILAAARSPYPSFNSRQLDEKLALYHERLKTSGPPDIMIIGSSRALRGVDPVALQKALAAQGYPGLSVFNFGVNGATAQVVDLIIRRIVSPSQQPKLIIWADGARAFNSGRVDITYNAIAASEGYRYLEEQARIQAQATPNPDTASPDESSAPVASSARDRTPPSLAASYRAVNQSLNETLAKVSATYGQREQLKTLLREAWARLNSPKPSQTPATDDPTTQPGDTVQDVSVYAVDFDGFLPLSVRFNPATYYQKYSRVAGDFDADYDSFELAGKQDAAVTALVEFTKAHNIDLVFVNTPLTHDYLDPVRRDYEQQFQKHMLRLASQKGFVFRDLGQVWPHENDYFSDPSHLNRYGAYEVSHRLAQDALIPWPRPHR